MKRHQNEHDVLRTAECEKRVSQCRALIEVGRVLQSFCAILFVNVDKCGSEYNYY